MPSNQTIRVGRRGRRRVIKRSMNRSIFNRFIRAEDNQKVEPWHLSIKPVPVVLMLAKQNEAEQKKETSDLFSDDDCFCESLFFIAVFDCACWLVPERIQPGKSFCLQQNFLSKKRPFS